MKGKITIKEIATLAGVSAGTVDRVLHKRGEVSQETMDKIMKIVHDLEYEPNVIASSLASKKSYSIAILIPAFTKSNPYWFQPLEGIMKAEDELAHFDFSANYQFYDFTDEESFKDKTALILDNPPDGLIVAPFFRQETQHFVEECEKLNIPFVFIDSRLKTTNYLSYFGQDSFNGGYLSAKLMNYIVPEHAKILVVSIAKTLENTNHIKQRIDGFKSFFDSDENTQKIELIHQTVPDAMKLQDIHFDQSINLSNNISGIFVPNTRAFIIAEYLERKQINNIRLIGYDLIRQNMAYLEKGRIDFLICQKPHLQGYKAVVALFNHLVLKKKVNKDNLMQLDILTKENYKYYTEI
jgi:LacI family transcriptional regulator